MAGHGQITAAFYYIMHDKVTKYGSHILPWFSLKLDAEFTPHDKVSRMEESA